MQSNRMLAKSLLFLLTALTVSGLLFGIQIFAPSLAYAQLPMYGPALAALLFLRREQESISAFLKSRFDFRLPLPVLLAAVVIPSLVNFSVAMVAGGLAKNALDFGSDPVLFALLILSTLPAVIGEEIGWRGYLLPRLQARYSPTVSTLILGVIWGAWHIPIKMGGGITPFLFWFLGLMAFNFLVTLLYNRTKPSIWSAILLHYAINISALLLLYQNPIGAMLPMGIIWSVVALLVMLVEWKSLSAKLAAGTA